MANLQAQLAKQKRYDAIFVNATKVFALLVLFSLGGILISLIIGAWPSMQEFGLGFYTSSEWDPVQDKYGALAPIYGTLVTSVIAICIAVPVSFGIAIFLTELCPAFLRRPLGIAIELLAGIPSIIYGMWGLFVFAPFLETTSSHGSSSMSDHCLSSASCLRGHPWASDCSPPPWYSPS